MHRNPSPHLDSDRANLLPTHPHARVHIQPLAPNPHHRDRFNHRLLQLPHPTVQILPQPRNIKNRISHQLPNPMISNIPAPISGMNVDAPGAIPILREQQILRMKTRP